MPVGYGHNNDIDDNNHDEDVDSTDVTPANFHFILKWGTKKTKTLAC